MVQYKHTYDLSDLLANWADFNILDHRSCLLSRLMLNSTVNQPHCLLSRSNSTYYLPTLQRVWGGCIILCQLLHQAASQQPTPSRSHHSLRPLIDLLFLKSFADPFQRGERNKHKQKKKANNDMNMQSF